MIFYMIEDIVNFVIFPLFVLVLIVVIILPPYWPSGKRWLRYLMAKLATLVLLISDLLHYEITTDVINEIETFACVTLINSVISEFMLQRTFLMLATFVAGGIMLAYARKSIWDYILDVPLNHH